MQEFRPANAIRNLRFILLGLWILSLLVLLIQNWGSPARVVVGGQSGSPLPLSLVLLASYGAGMGLGFLYVGSWRLHDRVFQRQAIRKLNQLSDRVRFLEAQMISPDHYLPQDLPEPEYAPDPYAGRYSYSNIPPERIREEEVGNASAPNWRSDEEEEWDS